MNRAFRYIRAAFIAAAIIAAVIVCSFGVWALASVVDVLAVRAVDALAPAGSAWNLFLVL